MQLLPGADVLLPDWAQRVNASGYRQVWLLPVLEDGESEWNRAALLQDTNRHLGWFAQASADKLHVEATRVLDTARYTKALPGGSSCNAMVRQAVARIGEFLAETAETPDIHLVILSRVRDCTYGGIAAMNGRYVIIVGLPEASEVRAGTLIHELGHNLGLPHASGRTGGLLSFERRPSSLGQEQEYGDQVDVMGSADPPFELAPPSAAALGWGQDVYQIPNRQAGSYELRLPAVSADGPDAAVVDDPVTGTRYAFSFVNAPTRRSVPGITVGRGVYVHEINHRSTPAAVYGRQSFATFLPWDPHQMCVGAQQGDHWIAPSGAIAVTVGKVLDGQVEITIGVDPQGGMTDQAGPTFPVKPTVTVNRGVATVRVPAAWDQSAVAGYRLQVRGVRGVKLAPPTGLFALGQASFPLTRRTVVKVTVTDTVGNTTVWKRTLRPR